MFGDTVMKQLLVFLLIINSAAGCAVAKQTYTADGREGYSINCSGEALTWGACFEKAGEICATRGYDILEQSGDQGAMISATQAGAFGTTTISRSMLIACK